MEFKAIKMRNYKIKLCLVFAFETLGLAWAQKNSLKKAFEKKTFKQQPATLYEAFMVGFFEAFDKMTAV